MDRTLHLQHLKVPLPAVLPAQITIDVAAIARWAVDTCPTDNFWPELVSTIQLGPRQARFVVPLDSASGSSLHRSDLLALAQRLQALGADTIERQLTASQLAVKSSAKPGIVLAGVEDRARQLWPLGVGIPAILDIATGKLWTPELANAECGPLETLLHREIILNPEGTEPRIGEALRFADEIAHLTDLSEGTLESLVASKKLSRRVGLRLAKERTEIERHVQAIREATIDEASQAVVQALNSPGEVPDSYYVVASVVDGKLSSLQMATNSVVEVHGEQRCHELLRQTVSAQPRARWYVARALELLAAMARGGLRLPVHVVDPALAGYCLNPDSPQPLEAYLPALHRLTPDARRSLNDVKRTSPGLRPDDLRRTLSLLPDLDRTLRRLTEEAGQTYLIEHDLGHTLPPLAYMEACGLFVADKWEITQAIERVRSDVEGDALLAAHTLGADPCRLDDKALWSRTVRALGRLPEENGGRLRLNGSQTLERFAAMGSREARAISRARSASETLTWLHRQQKVAGGRLTGRYAPARTGRWNLKDLALHSLPKRTVGAETCLALLRAPAGTVFLSADWGAFEPRLLAACTGDEFLLTACQSDPYNAVALALGVDRPLAKKLMLSSNYGQTWHGFVKEAVELRPDAAQRLYDQFARLVSAGKTNREAALGQLQSHSGVIQLSSGWRRCFSCTDRSAHTQRQAANFRVQGLAATILRHVLRRLWVLLPQYGGMLVHQAHDQVIVAVPPAALNTVAHLLRAIMSVETQVFLPCPVPLPIKLSHGTTWAELA